MARQHEELKSRLDAFVRKYHRNEMLRGALILAASVPMAWLVVIGLEAVGRFGTDVRTALFYLFLATVTTIAVRYLLLPGLRLLVRLRSGLDHDTAARIIGRHFPDIEDRLLNTLQLQSRAEADEASRELILASIQQRSDQLRPYRFTSAVDFGENRRYLKYVLPPVALFAGLYLALPEAMEAPTDRLIHHRTEALDLPDFRLVHDGEVRTIARTDFTLTIRTEGTVVPARVDVQAGEGRFRMERNGDGAWEHTFRAVRESMDLVVSAPGTPASTSS